MKPTVLLIGRFGSIVVAKHLRLENVTIRLHNGIACSLANLDEEPTEALSVSDGQVTLPAVGPKKIVTLRWQTA